MAIEEDIVFRINYQLEGVERSISTSRRALFTLNAVRLSIRDIQQVLSGPTIANVLFTAIQLTRTLTQARRLTKALAAEQATAGVASLLGLAGGRGVPGLGAIGGGVARQIGRMPSPAGGLARTEALRRLAVSSFFPGGRPSAGGLLDLPSGVVSRRLSLLAAEQAAQAGFFSGIISNLGVVGAFAIANPIILGAVAIAGGFFIFKNQEIKTRNEYRERNREIARTQGLEP